MSSERHALKIEDLLKALDATETGLTADEGIRRLEEFGPNELVEKKRVTPLQIFFGQFTDIFVIMLLIAIGISVAIGELVDASIIGAIVVLNAMFGFIQEYRAEKAMDAMRKLLSDKERNP